jgi:hypothetical protein
MISPRSREKHEDVNVALAVARENDSQSAAHYRGASSIASRSRR